MARLPLNTGWTVKPKVSGFSDLMASRDPGLPVTLPHDAMISLQRDQSAGEGPSTAWFPGGVVEYLTTLEVPQEWRQRRVSLEFQGVYRDAMVFVNGSFAGHRPNGYVPFTVALDPYLAYGQANEIRVEARAHQDSRWYSGLGIHRDVTLVVTPLTHLLRHGVRVTTPQVEDDLAVVETAVTVRNEGVGTGALTLHVGISDAAGRRVVSDQSPVTVLAGSSAVVRHRLPVADPQLWDVDSPHLYLVVATLRDGEAVVDEVQVPLGIRELRLDPRHGLRINGRTVKLRGACLHHDNGLLGAAAIGRAEERRIEILKAAGFNAIRSAHNPISEALLDACDRLGMLVLDEAFDMWLEGMKSFDYSLAFPEWWERDIEAMVARDFNHPSVILYSVGNEVPEAGSGHGAALGRELAEKVRSLDDTRYVTNAVSSFWAVSREILDDFRSEVAALEARGVNDVMNELGEIFDRITTSELVTERTWEMHAAVDVVGLNYAEERYASDGLRFPNRVILGTETNPRNTDRIWRLVEDLPHVIGDFTWTGWDYLGEVGLGRTDYPDDDPAVRGGGDPAYPWLLAWCGDIDIIGHRRPQSYYREIVWGLRHEPYIAVYRPEHHGKPRAEMSWAWSDTVSSWSWPVPAGSPVEVEVYSSADEVELLLDDEPLGRAPAGPDHRFRAHFQVEYRPGTLTAVAYAHGKECARTSLRTAGQTVLTASADRTVLVADERDLAFVAIELRDRDGNLATGQDRAVGVDVRGAGVLQALGSARPVTEERYDAREHSTFDGRALAIVRPTRAGEITVTITSEGLAPVSLLLSAA